MAKDNSNKDDNVAASDMPARPDINIHAEFKRGYMVFKAFEYGLELSEKLSSLEQDLRNKAREVGEFVATYDKAAKEHEVKIQELTNAAAEASNRIEVAHRLRVEEMAEELATAQNAIKAAKSAYTKTEASIKAAEEKLVAANQQLIETEERHAGLIASIEEAKSQISRFVDPAQRINGARDSGGAVNA